LSLEIGPVLASGSFSNLEPERYWSQIVNVIVRSGVELDEQSIVLNFLGRRALEGNIFRGVDPLEAQKLAETLAEKKGEELLSRELLKRNYPTVVTKDVIVYTGDTVLLKPGDNSEAQEMRALVLSNNGVKVILATSAVKSWRHGEIISLQETEEVDFEFIDDSLDPCRIGINLNVCGAIAYSDPEVWPFLKSPPSKDEVRLLKGIPNPVIVKNLRTKLISFNSRF